MGASNERRELFMNRIKGGVLSTRVSELSDRDDRDLRFS